MSRVPTYEPILPKVFSAGLLLALGSGSGLPRDNPK